VVSPPTAASSQVFAPGRGTPGNHSLTSTVFQPAEAASAAAYTNGATVRVGGPDDGGISDDDVDVPPFMRH